MWKLAPASNSKHLFSEGDQIRIRSGNHVSSELTLVRLPDSKKLVWREEGGRENYVGWSRDFMTRGAMSEMGDFYGRTVDLFVKEEKEEVTSNVKEVPANTLVLVGKQFTKLIDGLRLVFKPYDSNPDPRVFTAVVSRHGSGRFLDERIECMQVHIQLEGKPYTTITFTGNLDDRTVQELNFFEKFSCYLVKNYQKEEQSAAPKASREPEKYIVWTPDSNLPPRVVHNNEAQAKAVAASMSERHGKTFYWCKLVGKAEQVKTQKVITVNTTKTTTL